MCHISPLCITHIAVNGPERRLKTAPPESHVSVIGIIPALSASSSPWVNTHRKKDGEQREKEGRKGGWWLLSRRSSWSSHGTALGYPRDHASPSLPPECQQHMRIFTPLALLSSGLLCFQEKFLSEVFRGCNISLCCRWQEPEGGFSGHAQRLVYTAGHWERSWSITLLWLPL